MPPNFSAGTFGDGKGSTVGSSSGEFSATSLRPYAGHATAVVGVTAKYVL